MLNADKPFINNYPLNSIPFNVLYRIMKITKGITKMFKIIGLVFNKSLNFDSNN